VARLGGDEFVVLMADIDDQAVAASQKTAHVAEKIRQALAAPYQLQGNTHHSSPSIGVSMFIGNDEGADVLLRQADMAMYKAKDAGRNTLRFFSPAMQLAVETRAALEADLRNAAARGELLLHYQVQVDELDPSAARIGFAAAVHPDCRGKFTDPGNWQLGHRHRLRPARRLAAQRGLALHVDGRQRQRAAISPARFRAQAGRRAGPAWL
jgi:predicted signal transduction protein with EAL and GGDEF domain